MEIIKTIISIATLLSCSITLASTHIGNLNITIINNSHDDYLFFNAEMVKNTMNADYIAHCPQPALAMSTTNNAFTAEVRMEEYNGLAPEGKFTYENPQDKSICAFSFNAQGVFLLNNNMHCSVSNGKTLSSFGIPYQWNAVVTIS